MNKKTLALTAVAFFAALAPAFAGEVFVPLASNATVGGVLHRTTVRVSNPSTADLPFDVTFIPAETDGSALPPTQSSITVRAGSTLVLGNVAPSGASGFVQVSGAAQLVVAARVQALSASGALLASTSLPAVSQDNAVAAGATVELVGLSRTADGLRTDFALVNLSRDTAHCTLKAFRSDGSGLASAISLSLKPLSQRLFSEALQTLGALAISDVRFEVSCDKQFFPFARVYRPSGPDFDFIAPSPSLATDLVPGGPKGSDGSVLFDVAGTFLRATDSNSFISYDLPATAGAAYRRATIEYDMTIGQFSQVLLFTGVHSFRRPSTDRNQRVLYYGIQITNKNAKTTLDLGVKDVVVKTIGPWKAGHGYHVKIVYDLDQKQVTLETYEGGVLTYTIAGDALHADLSANANPLEVDFGQTGIGDGAYGPPIGWSFANLHVELVPK